MDKLLNKGKSKSPTLFKVPYTPWGQFWDFRGHLEVILWSFRGQNAIFQALCSSLDKLPNKEKVSLYLNSKCQTHPEVNIGTLKAILRSFRGQVQFFFKYM